MNIPQQINLHNPQVISSSSTSLDHGQENCNPIEAHSNSLLCSLFLLKEKVHQVQSLVSILTSAEHHGQQGLTREPTSIAVANMGTTIQEIIVTASAMMFTCQQMAIGGGGENAGPIGASGNNRNNDNVMHANSSRNQESDLSQPMENRVLPRSFYSETFDWYGDSYNINNSSNNNSNIAINNYNNSNAIKHVSSNINNREPQGGNTSVGSKKVVHTKSSTRTRNYDIIELDAADLLAKYTHYCEICGKGFKRDANLRMHMRAHGDEYKTSAALSNPIKKNKYSNTDSINKEDPSNLPRKYSCPHEGCRWNQKHAKFQPLKSMICVKNHYKRSHCPKMYVCKRCNSKQFSVLSDLRTHEKHCGELKWQCSCGTTFSRKDKLMGHVALFVGHSPITSPPLTKPN